MQNLCLIIVVLTVLSVSFAHIHDLSALEGYNFEHFNKDYGLGLKAGSSEYVKRKAFFEMELARVKAHNAMNRGWKETINKFSAMSKDEKRNFHGRNKGARQAHKLKGVKGTKEVPYDSSKDLPLSQLPKAIDWRTKGVVSAVKDQGHCGSCWAFASTAHIESSVAKNTGLLFDLSVQQMAFCAPNPDSCGGTGGCMGSTSEIAFDYVAKSNGMVQEYQMGYGAYFGNESTCAIPDGAQAKIKIDGYTRIPENEYEPFMNSLAKEGPIAISVDASNWHAYHSGVFSGCDQTTPDIDHAVVAVGYGEEADGTQYWIVRNSWSATWGEAGYIRLARQDSQSIQCGMDVTPQDGTACEGQTDPVKVCGTCGILYDNAYVVGADLVGPAGPNP